MPPAVKVATPAEDLTFRELQDEVEPLRKLSKAETAAVGEEADLLIEWLQKFPPGGSPKSQVVRRSS